VFIVGRRILGKLLQAVVTIAIVCIIVFLLLRLIPGDPALQILGNEATPASIAALHAQLHLDEPLPQQFGDYFAGLLRGDLGSSLVQHNTSVVSIIAAAVPSTASIAIGGLIVGVGGGVAFGLWAAVTRYRALDATVQAVSIVSYATPTFLFSLILILFVSLTLHLLPAGGWAGMWPANFAYVILPSIAIGVNLAPRFIRTVRQEAIDVQGRQFMEAAISRGLPRRRLNQHHVLPNSLLPVITLVGISLGGLLTNAVVVEAVFGMPGLGSELAKAVERRDYPVIQGITLVLACAVIAGNLLAEIAYSIVDPRARVR
jgi:peptide/nickel transport system permease protein